MDEEKKQEGSIAKNVSMVAVRSAVLYVLSYIVFLVLLHITGEINITAPRLEDGEAIAITSVLSLCIVLVHFIKEWKSYKSKKSEKSRWKCMIVTSIFVPALILLCLYINQLLYKL